MIKVCLQRTGNSSNDAFGINDVDSTTFQLQVSGGNAFIVHVDNKPLIDQPHSSKDITKKEWKGHAVLKRNSIITFKHYNANVLDSKSILDNRTDKNNTEKGEYDLNFKLIIVTHEQNEMHHDRSCDRRGAQNLDTLRSNLQTKHQKHEFHNKHSQEHHNNKHSDSDSKTTDTEPAPKNDNVCLEEKLRDYLREESFKLLEADQKKCQSSYPEYVKQPVSSSGRRQYDDVIDSKVVEEKAHSDNDNVYPKTGQETRSSNEACTHCKNNHDDQDEILSCTAEEYSPMLLSLTNHNVRDANESKSIKHPVDQRNAVGSKAVHPLIIIGTNPATQSNITNSARSQRFSVLLMPLGQAMPQSRVSILSSALVKNENVEVLRSIKTPPTHVVIDEKVPAPKLASALGFRIVKDMEDYFVKVRS